MAIGPDGNAWQIPPLNFVVINIWWSQSCKHVSTMPTCRCCCSWIKNAAGAIFFYCFQLWGGDEVCGVIWNRIKPKKVVGKVTQHCNGEMRNWLGKCSILLGKCSNLLGKRCNLLGKWSKFVGEMKQMDGEMKQNVLGRCPEDKVNTTHHGWLRRAGCISQYIALIVNYIA